MSPTRQVYSRETSDSEEETPERRWSPLLDSSTSLDWSTLLHCLINSLLLLFIETNGIKNAVETDMVTEVENTAEATRGDTTATEGRRASATRLGCMERVVGIGSLGGAIPSRRGLPCRRIRLSLSPRSSIRPGPASTNTNHTTPTHPPTPTRESERARERETERKREVSKACRQTTKGFHSAVRLDKG
jgi:hypothetical protein